MKSLWTQLGEDSPDEGPLPEVRVVMGVSTSDTPYSEVLKWCVGEGMELIEWERGGSPQPQDTGICTYKVHVHLCATIDTLPYSNLHGTVEPRLSEHLWSRSRSDT